MVRIQSIILTQQDFSISKIMQSKKRSEKKKKTSNSFEFTSYWADEKTVPSRILWTLQKPFFAKHTLLNILTRYCVFTSEDLLLVMRPYQIAATEKILNRIIVSTNLKKIRQKRGRRLYLAYHRKRQDFNQL